MAVHDAASFDPGREQRAAAAEETKREPLDVGGLIRIQDPTVEGRHLPEAVGPPSAQPLRPTLLVDPRATVSARVKGRQLVRQRTESSVERGSAGHQRRQASVCGHSMHHHHRLL